MSAEPSKNDHWADRVALEVERAGREPVVSTGISPSGEIHIGNMREVITGDAVYRALRDRGVAARFNYVADDLDPLRRVYPFLDADRYTPLVGRPLSAIPAPAGGADSYADHFLEPFVRSLETLHVRVEIERASAMYASGRMSRYVGSALESRDTIAEILRETTGKQVAADWSPFNPICGRCGRIDRARVTGFSTSEATVSYECGCGAAGEVPFAGGGKLTWRVDWPARWMALGVTVEPFGKDHAGRGGSYESGVRIVREVFDGEAPHPIPYEWIRLKGRGDMSSSKGNVLSIAKVLEVVPPEALRYLVIRTRPQRSISFDPGLPLLQLVDEVDDAAAKNRDERALDLSRAGEFLPVGVPFKHLVVVAQVVGFDTRRTVDTLRRTGYPEADETAVARRMEYARRWLESFAPDDLKFRVQPDLPREAETLSSEQRAFLRGLGERLRSSMDGPQIHQLIYDLAGESPAEPATLFRGVYLALLGKPRGPRAGWFISVLGVEFCAERFARAGRSGA